MTPDLPSARGVNGSGSSGKSANPSSSAGFSALLDVVSDIWDVTRDVVERDALVIRKSGLLEKVSRV